MLTLVQKCPKAEMYSAGEELFALKITTHPELVKIKREACLLDQLYGLYMDVLQTLERLVVWVDFDCIPGTYFFSSPPIQLNRVLPKSQTN